MSTKLNRFCNAAALLTAAIVSLATSQAGDHSYPYHNWASSEAVNLSLSATSRRAVYLISVNTNQAAFPVASSNYVGTLSAGLTLNTSPSEDQPTLVARLVAEEVAYSNDSTLSLAGLSASMETHGSLAVAWLDETCTGPCSGTALLSFEIAEPVPADALITIGWSASATLENDDVEAGAATDADFSITIERVE